MSDIDFNNLSDDQLIELAMQKAQKEGVDLQSIIAPQTPLKKVGQALDPRQPIKPLADLKENLQSGVSDSMEEFSKQYPKIATNPAVQIPLATLGAAEQTAAEMIPTNSIDVAASVLPASKVAREGITSIADKIGNMTAKVGNKIGETGIMNLGKLTDKGKIKVIETAEDAVENSRQGIMQKYGSQLNDLMKTNAGKTMDMTDAFYNLKSRLANPDTAGEMSGAVNKSRTIKQYLRKIKVDPQTGAFSGEIKMPVKDVDTMLSDLQQYSKGKNYFKHPAREFHDKVQEAAVNQFEGMDELKSGYKESMDKYRSARGELLVKNILENVEKGYANPKIRRDINMLLPPEAIKELKGYANAARALKVLKWVGGIGGGGTIIGGIANKLRK